MRYAVIQDSLEAPDREALRRAFAGVPGLTAADADILGKDAFGILVKGKSEQEAEAIQGALRTQGIATVVVPENRLPELPPTKFVKQLECRPEALTLCDAVGRGFPVEWGHLMLIAAGSVQETLFVRQTTTRPVRRRLAFPGAEHGCEYEDIETEVRQREERAPTLMLELVLTRAVARFSVKADTSAPMLFNYLGGRKTGSLPRNFSLLVQDLCRFAPHAALNRGAWFIREDTGRLFDYPSKNAFHEEIIWLLWRMKAAQ